MAILACLLLAGGAIYWFKWRRKTDPGSNDTAAMATLRRIATCQKEFRQRLLVVDLDKDGIGEFGFLDELAGAAGVRTSPAGDTRGSALPVPLLSAALAIRDSRQPVARKGGFQFRIYLPAAADAGVHEKHAGAPYSAPVDTDLAEGNWCAYAWPVNPGHTGQRALFIDAAGNLWESPNKNARYSAESRMPAWDAALPMGTHSWTTRRTAAGRGNDLDEWTEVK